MKIPKKYAFMKPAKFVVHFLCMFHYFIFFFICVLFYYAIMHKMQGIISSPSLKTLVPKVWNKMREKKLMYTHTHIHMHIHIYINESNKQIQTKHTSNSFEMFMTSSQLVRLSNCYKDCSASFYVWRIGIMIP